MDEPSVEIDYCSSGIRSKEWVQFGLRLPMNDSMPCLPSTNCKLCAIVLLPWLCMQTNKTNVQIIRPRWRTSKWLITNSIRANGMKVCGHSESGLLSDCSGHIPIGTGQVHIDLVVEEALAKCQHGGTLGQDCFQYGVSLPGTINNNSKLIQHDASHTWACRLSLSSTTWVIRPEDSACWAVMGSPVRTI